MAKQTIMKLTTAQDFLQTIAGPYASEIVKIYEKKHHPITDEVIEKKIKLKVTEIRTILNQLHYRGIAEYQKKRNEKTGWYIYTWEIKTHRIAELLLAQQTEKEKKIQEQFEFSKTHAFFTCKKKCENIIFEVAAEYNFKCPQCNQPMQSINNKKNSKNLEQQLKTIKEEIKELQELQENINKKQKNNTQILGQIKRKR